MSLPPYDPSNPPTPDPNQPGYASYYRPGQDGHGGYGSVDKLQALADGYFGLNTVFIINIAIALASRLFAGLLETTETAAIAAITMIILLFAAISALTYPKNKLIGYGLDWKPSGPLVASLLMGLNSALCCGVIGYIVVQNMAYNEMKKYGVKKGFFGVRKKDVDAQIVAMKTAPAGYAPPRFGA